MRYFSLPEIELFANKSGFKIISSEEWLSGKIPSFNTWGVCWFFRKMDNYIPVNEPIVGAREKQLVNQCLDSGWISAEGHFVSRFENEMSKKVGRNFGIACSNGTAALEIAIKALGIGEGDEVIMPTFTIISCANAIIKTGAKPVLVDSDPITWNIQPNNIEQYINSRTVAIMIVHIYGLPVDMDPILKVADKYKLAVIEDAAELIGGKYKNKPCGSFGTISTMSFYPNKHITTGEGGMVLTNDLSLAEKCKSLRNLCFQKNRFVHEEIGWNYRMSKYPSSIRDCTIREIGTIHRKEIMDW